jgi:hypothetical protein
MRHSILPRLVQGKMTRPLTGAAACFTVMILAGWAGAAPVGDTQQDGGGLKTSSSSVKVGRLVAPGVREVRLVLPENLTRKRPSGSGGLFSPEKVGSMEAGPVSVGGAKDWTTLLSDDFESGFPGTTWTLYYEETGPYWDDWTCSSGSSPPHSVGCAAGGDGAINCDDNYPNDLNTFMTAGPFSLADPDISAGVLECSLELDSELEIDFFFMLVSIEGEQDWNGFMYSGAFSHKTISMDLAEVPNLGNILGEPEVWVSFGFRSNELIVEMNGAQVDDVVLAVDMSAGNQPPLVELTSLNGGEALSVGSTTAITYRATDPGGVSDDLILALDYSTNSGSTWTNITTGQSNTGFYNWTVPDLPTTTARVQVRVSNDEGESTDSSDADFSIVQTRNNLDLGDASGPSGTSVTVQLALENEDAVKGIEADVSFDGTKAFFSGIAATSRSVGMVVKGDQISQNRAHIVLYFDNDSQLTPGSGDVAEVTFTLQGPGGGQTALALIYMILSDPAGNPLLVTGTNGHLTVEAPLDAPTLQISVLKNPGRPATMQILVRVANGSGTAPTVTADDSSVAMTSLGQAVYLGTYSATQTASSVTISASDTNLQGTGTAQVTVDAR